MYAKEKILKKVFLFLFLMPLFLQASNWTVEGRVAYFYPTSKLLREIYPVGGVDYQLEASRRIFCDWHLWGSANYFTKKGHSVGLHDDTRISIAPFSLGVKYDFSSFNYFSPYIGIGASYTLFQCKDDSEYVKEHVRKNTFGFVVKSGLSIPLGEHFFVDVFTDYYYQKLHFKSERGVSRHDLDIGGFKFGAGIGAAF